MRYRIEIKKIPAWKLNFDNSIPMVDFKTDMPLLVDQENRVLLGSCLRACYPADKEVSAIVVQIRADSEHLKGFLTALEVRITSEKNKERLYSLERDVKSYVASFRDYFEEPSLFDTIKQEDVITVKNYLKPLPTKLAKAKEEKKDGVIVADIFGWYGFRGDETR